jgi:putative DNA primase/helicase
MSDRNLTEAGNAERLADQHAKRFRYCGALGGWLRWSGAKWEPGEAGLLHAALQTVRAMYDEAKEIEDDDNRRDLIKHALRSESHGALRAMCSIARDLPAFVADASAFDADPWQLNVGNGTVNLRTGELKPHDSAAMHTQVAGVEFDPTATCPRWLAFLDEVLPSPELRAFLQRFVGYCLTGDTSERAFVVFHGSGRNGKSVIVKILHALLGDYACYADKDLVLATKDDKHTTMLADLKGKRFAGMSEVERGRKLAGAMLKRLTGDEPITGRRMHCDNMTFPMTAKLAMACNDRPEASGDDQAIWDRIRNVPFAVRIAEEKVDKSLADKLRGELPGILNWALEGLAEWRKDGLGVPPEVAAATDAYRGESDHVRRFLTECYEIDDSARLPRKELRDRFNVWSGVNVPFNEQGLFSRMSDKDWTKETRGRLGENRETKMRDGSRCWHLRPRQGGSEDDGTTARDGT